MNNLSWFIYLADMFGDLEVLMWILAVPLGAAGMIFIIAVAIAMSEGMEADEAKVLKSLATWLSVGFVLCSVSIALIPSKNTMYAIAASEMGEELLKSPTVTKATKALDAWLDQQLNKQAKPAPAN